MDIRYKDAATRREREQVDQWVADHDAICIEWIDVETAGVTVHGPHPSPANNAGVSGIAPRSSGHLSDALDEAFAAMRAAQK